MFVVRRYGEYPELCGYLHKYIKPKDEILNVGCGNSKLTMDLYDVGYRQVTCSISVKKKTSAHRQWLHFIYRGICNIDTSHLVINQMRELNKIDRPDLKYLAIDACQMTEFEDNKFSVVLDKATIDAVMPDNTDKSKAYVKQYWSEIARVLRIGGRYICISLLQNHIIEALVAFFTERDFMLRVVRCLEAEEKTNESSNDGTSLPVFMVIATKFQKMPSPVLETCMAGDKMVRVQSNAEWVNAVLSVQKAAMVCNGLHRGNIAGGLFIFDHNDFKLADIIHLKFEFILIADMSEVSLDLYRPADPTTPRFTVYVLDQAPKRGNGKYAAFIVPQGR